MNDQQFAAFLEVFKEIRDHLEITHIALSDIKEELSSIRNDYETANRLDTDEEWFDRLQTSIHGDNFNPDSGDAE